MSKEYVLQFNLNNYISAEESYKKDLGTVIIGKVNDDSGILKVLFDSHKEDIVNFFIELIKYVAALQTKLAEQQECSLKASSKHNLEMQNAQICVKELEEKLAEKDKELAQYKNNWYISIDSLKIDENVQKIANQKTICELEKVKEYWLKHEDIGWYIDNQIKLLKGG